MRVERIPGPVPLHAELTGSGSTLVLMHGFGGSARNLRPQARALGGRHRVVLFDLRGHGRSEAPRERAAYRPACFVADIARVLDHVGTERAVVGGLSMGAGLALRFAIAHPERTRGLVLAAAPPGAGESGHERWAHRFAQAIEEEGIEEAGKRFVWGPGAGLDRRTARLIRMGFTEHPPHGLVHTLRELVARQPAVTALEEQLLALRVPTLIVVGGADAISRGPSEELVRTLPDARLVVIEDAGHVVNLDGPQAFDAALAQFLAELPPAED